MQKIFLLEALAPPIRRCRLADDGKIYSQNDGNLFVVGQ